MNGTQASEVNQYSTNRSPKADRRLLNSTVSAVRSVLMSAKLAR